MWTERQSENKKVTRDLFVTFSRFLVFVMVTGFFLKSRPRWGLMVGHEGIEPSTFWLRVSYMVFKGRKKSVSKTLSNPTTTGIWEGFFCVLLQPFTDLFFWQKMSTHENPEISASENLNKQN